MECVMLLKGIIDQQIKSSKVDDMNTDLHWKYFLSIDNDLKHLSRYIEFTYDNYCVYSIEIVRLYLSICSEIDSIMKQLCVNKCNSLYKRLCKQKNGYEFGNMDIYRMFISECYPLFYTAQVPVPEYQLSFKPWELYGIDKNPEWWKDHNHVKHERGKNYNLANLENVLNATAGLLVVLIYYFAGEKRIGIDGINHPKLFALPDFIYHRGARFAGDCLIVPELQKNPFKTQ